MIRDVQATNGGAISVPMSARVWAGIDAEIDNVVSLAAVGGDEEAVRVGSAIREAGWDQVPWVDGQWPPFGQTITITLTRAQWRFALAADAKSIPIYEELGDHESAGLARAAIAVVSPYLN